ncbi:hypothetical protein Golob_025085 [Gossypium lobatum]|uniref:Uncharacterized protein n=1 Tax=Gossypium lobatum TaxID=34289 RepID=A0A7J8NDE2_9ROSI|nr:hypothetical protein [Gossypium lobatum]
MVSLWAPFLLCLLLPQRLGILLSSDSLALTLRF